MNILIIIALIIYFLQVLCVLGRLEDRAFDTKLEFLMNLIPFYWVAKPFLNLFRTLYENYKELE